MAYAQNQISSGGGYGIGLTAGEAIAAGLIVKIATADGNVYKATATTDVLVGAAISTAAAAGDAISIAVPGDVVQVKAGGTVTRGTEVMFVTGAKIENATGNVQILGVALASGVDGDLLPVLITLGATGTG